MKKKLLFVLESLGTGGAEKSLVSFLSGLDYDRFDVNLQLFRYGGELERYVPKQVCLLPPLDYTVFAGKRFGEQLRSRDNKKLIRRLLYSLTIRIGKNKHADTARKYWKTIGPCIPNIEELYDVAIAYSQGIPTFYVADKVCAQFKFAWVNVGYSLSGKNVSFQSSFYRKMQHIVCVSETSKDVFDQEFPAFRDKTLVIRDRIDTTLIRKLAEEYPAPVEKDIPIILTVARFAPQKGYDVALKTCLTLKERGIRFKWYAIGRGPLKSEMERFINENGLQDHFIFLGTFANPYPYFKAATLYVQTSRHEGYGLSIAEARVLGVPVVTTEYDSVWQQMVQGKNGMVIPREPSAVADAIEKLLTDRDLYDSIVSYQFGEQNDNTEEVMGKFFGLIESSLY